MKWIYVFRTRVGYKMHESTFWDSNSKSGYKLHKHKPLLFHGRLGDTNSKGVGYKMHEPSKVLGTKCINHFLDLDLGF